ncbi:MAG TPA: aldose epimerase family protein [Gemmatimonadaceae bacterium]|jgi:aldose 1-epimerase|nr:aldose epimerase family protein [Gemmatimonadaceae bacterium]
MSTDLFTLVNASGVEVRFLAYGGRIVSIRVPDRRGVLADVTPGYDDAADYRRDGRFFGALVGRYANRIGGGCFRLDGEDHELARNEGANQLHGGPRGFHAREWDVTPFASAGMPALEMGGVLRLESAAGDQGFPGTLDVRVTYTLRDDNTFTIELNAVADAPTPVNLTQHTYFNLAGHDAGDILGHELFINASAITPIDQSLIPIGTMQAVRGTAFDFTTQRTIGSAMAQQDEQLLIGGGFDHNFVLDARVVGRPTLAARVHEPVSGRTLEIFTTAPGVQFYSGNGVDDGAPGKGGHRYVKHGALALETQHFPDSPNRPQFPNTILRPGREYRSRTIWRFSAH